MELTTSNSVRVSHVGGWAWAQQRVVGFKTSFGTSTRAED